MTRINEINDKKEIIRITEEMNLASNLLNNIIIEAINLNAKSIYFDPIDQGLKVDF